MVSDLENLTFSAAIPLALYIHLPWCVRKCPYCDFNSHAIPDRDETPYTAYVDVLLRDLESVLPQIWGRSIRSIFIGGGTPSLFPAEAMDALLSGIRARLPLQPSLEVTLEANPGTAEQSRFSGYRQAGVNRISIGAQSFDDQFLQKIGRIHSAEEAIRAVEMAKQAGFSRINLDLMFGLPEQSIENALADLQQAVALETEHLSWYQMTLEPNTQFGHSPPPVPSDEVLWEMQEAGQNLLREAGFAQYEISAYALSDQADAQCHHNLNYWKFGDYLGLGAGAHGKITDVAAGQIVRTSRQRDPKRYLETAGSEAVISQTRILRPAELPLEFMMNALRLKDGFPVWLFEERTGLPFTMVEEQIVEAKARGLLDQTESEVESKIVPTEQGRNFLNELLLLF